MARREALLKLHKALEARRADLRAKLLGDLNTLHSQEGRDSGDEAFDAGNEEINCQLAELEASELTQIERAIVKLKKGSYGTCESCNKKIPVARLNALPYSTLCIECQKEMENNPGWDVHGGSAGWDKLGDKAFSMEDSMETVNLADFEN